MLNKLVFLQCYVPKLQDLVQLFIRHVFHQRISANGRGKWRYLACPNQYQFHLRSLGICKTLPGCAHQTPCRR